MTLRSPWKARRRMPTTDQQDSQFCRVSRACLCVDKHNYATYTTTPLFLPMYSNNFWSALEKTSFRDKDTSVATSTSAFECGFATTDTIKALSRGRLFCEVVQFFCLNVYVYCDRQASYKSRSTPRDISTKNCQVRFFLCKIKKNCFRKIKLNKIFNKKCENRPFFAKFNFGQLTTPTTHYTYILHVSQ